MAAGLFAPQDVLIFKLFINKPYTKIYAVALGVQMGHLFNLCTDETRLHLVKKNKVFRVGLYLVSLLILSYVTLAPYPAQLQPMAWSNLHNSLFIALSRPLFIIGLMILMVLLFTSERNLLMRAFSHEFWTPLARLSYAVYLVFPIMSSILLSQITSSLVLSYYTMFQLICYCFLSSYLVAFLIYLTMESPIKHLV